MSARQKATHQANDQTNSSVFWGPGAKELVDTGDAVADKVERAAFVKAYKEKHALISYTADDEAMAAGAPQRLFMEIGKAGWPFPIPLVAAASGKAWSFDARQGAEEIWAAALAATNWRPWRFVSGLCGRPVRLLPAQS